MSSCDSDEYDMCEDLKSANVSEEKPSCSVAQLKFEQMKMQDDVPVVPLLTSNEITVNERMARKRVHPVADYFGILSKLSTSQNWQKNSTSPSSQEPTYVCDGSCYEKYGKDMDDTTVKCRRYQVDHKTNPQVENWKCNPNDEGPQKECYEGLPPGFSPATTTAGLCGSDSDSGESCSSSMIAESSGDEDDEEENEKGMRCFKTVKPVLW